MSWYSLLFDQPLNPIRLNQVVSFLFKHHGTNVFNHSCYDSYDGNYAHYLPYHILNDSIMYDIEPKRAGCYVNLLFHLVENNKIHLNAFDYYNQTPMDALNDCLNSKMKQDVAIDYHFKTIQWIFQKKLAIVQQSFVRRWLAIRKTQRLRLQKVLKMILLSPPKQVEYIFFNNFEGGQYYHNAISSLKDRLKDG